MLPNDVYEYLKKCGWTDNDIRNLDDRHIDCTISFDEWKKTFVGAFCTFKKLPHVLDHISDALKQYIPHWIDFNAQNVKIIARSIADETSSNTARVYMAHIVSILNTYKDTTPEIPKVNYSKAVGIIKRTPTQHVVLSEEEINRLIEVSTNSETEDDVKRSFIIEALCGASTSDVEALSTDNIQDGWIIYVSKKTKTLTQVPLHKKILPFLSAKPSKEHNRFVTNVTIQRLCHRAGITEEVEIFKAGKRVKAPKWKLVGSHTARRSFATNLAVRNVPIATISKFMGHSDIKMTSKYICIDKSHITPDTMAFFN